MLFGRLTTHHRRQVQFRRVPSVRDRLSVNYEVLLVFEPPTSICNQDLNVFVCVCVWVYFVREEIEENINFARCVHFKIRFCCCFMKRKNINELFTASDGLQPNNLCIIFISNFILNRIFRYCNFQTTL